MKWPKPAFLLFGLVVWQVQGAVAQNQNVPPNHDFYHKFEREEVKSGEIIHSSFKPILQRKAEKLIETDSAYFPNLSPIKKEGRSWAASKLFHEHLIYLDSGNVQLSIDPLLNVEFGDDLRAEGIEERTYYKNMRGFVARLNLGDQVSIVSTFRENQAVLPHYLDQRTTLTGVAYGQGRTKNFGDYGYDFAMASAAVSYSPHERLNIQAGHGKHFIGEGYRSLLLSDMAFNYPYLRLQSDWLDGKVNYQNVYSLFQDLNRLEGNQSEGLFERKQGAFHFLNFSPDPRFSIGLFEGFIYPALDTSGNIDVPLNYWAPVIGLNTLLKGDERAGNSNLGVNVKGHLFKKLKLYSQLSFFDEKINQLAYQFGGKLFLGQAWTLQLEYNKGKQQAQTSSLYHHYNESLTHPYQSDCEEFLGGLYFHKNRWMTRLLINNIAYYVNVDFVDFRQSYIVNPAYNLTFNFGLQYRSDRVPTYTAASESLYLYFSLSTNLQNLYFNY
ncbi:MAG: hypothetical protein WD530_02795 [Vicingaceae bacterium]